MFPSTISNKPINLSCEMYKSQGETIVDRQNFYRPAMVNLRHTHSDTTKKTVVKFFGGVGFKLLNLVMCFLSLV